MYVVEKGQNAYPASLKSFKNAPLRIYCTGNLNAIIPQRTVAVIGMRDASEKALMQAERIGEMVAEMGYTLLNGLAIGCDQAAIRGALKKHGKVVAVMPCGLNQIYPASAKKYVDDILLNDGCLISGYEPSQAPLKHQFVERDRLQAAISDKIFVIAAEKNSGTMHTVNNAMKFGKPICCLNNPLSGNKWIIQNAGTKIDNQDAMKLFLSKQEEYEQLSLFA